MGSTKNSGEGQIGTLSGPGGVLPLQYEREFRIKTIERGKRTTWPTGWVCEETVSGTVLVRLWYASGVKEWRGQSIILIEEHEGSLLPMRGMVKFGSFLEGKAWLDFEAARWERFVNDTA